MINIIKSDLYRLRKSRAFYGVVSGAGLMIRVKIRLSIGAFGSIVVFKEAGDIIKLGLRHNQGLGILITILISVFIGQEYTWKTWQNKWLTSKTRVRIYISKLMLSIAASVSIFLLYQLIALLASGQLCEILTGKYLIIMLCGSFIYAVLGAVLCMLSILLQNA